MFKKFYYNFVDAIKENNFVPYDPDQNYIIKGKKAKQENYPHMASIYQYI